MPTYDLAGVAGAGAIPFDGPNKIWALQKTINVADVIASNAVLTAAAKITSGDILQLFDLPAFSVVLGSCIRVTTAEGSATTADLGIAGGDELQDGADVNTGSDAMTLTLVGDDWGPDNVTGKAFTATDTIDFTAKADIEAGVFVVTVWGVSC